MMRILSSVDKDSFSAQEWDAHIRRLPATHLLQSWAWGELKAHFGWQPLRLAVVASASTHDGETSGGQGKEQDQIVAAAQVLFRPLLHGLWTTAYIPKGPLLDLSPSNAPVGEALLAAVHDTCRRKRAIFLKIEPDWEDGMAARSWLQSQGFVSSQQTVQPRRTVVIDLRPGEEEILAQMKPKARYNIRLAERKGVSVRLGSAQDLPTFYRLLKITGQRDRFGIHTQAYYTQAYELFAAQETVALFLAQYEDKVLAALMAFAWGEKAWYMYGASGNEERQRMPNHLLQWEAMRWAKRRGCRSYDLWGIPDVDENEVGAQIAIAEEQGVLSTGLGGLYRFKRGFGGQEVRYVGAYDYVYNRPLYRLLTTAWNWRKSRLA